MNKRPVKWVSFLKDALLQCTLWKKNPSLSSEEREFMQEFRRADRRVETLKRRLAETLSFCETSVDRFLALEGKVRSNAEAASTVDSVDATLFKALMTARGLSFEPGEAAEIVALFYEAEGRKFVLLPNSETVVRAQCSPLGQMASSLAPWLENNAPPPPEKGKEGEEGNQASA